MSQPSAQVARAIRPHLPQTWAGSPCHLAIVLLLLITGCHPMPPGEVRTAKDADVILLRGWRDMYSDGINQLAGELDAEGYRAAVFGEAQWDEVADVVRHRQAAGGVVLIGFSFGADHAIDLARELEKANIPIPLLITIDPVTPAKVPENVAVCHNLYRSDGVWDLFPWFRGVPLEVDSPNVRLTNVDVNGHPTLDDPGLDHETIAASPKIHREIIDLIKKHRPRGKM